MADRVVLSQLGDVGQQVCEVLSELLLAFLSICRLFQFRILFLRFLLLVLHVLPLVALEHLVDASKPLCCLFVSILIDDFFRVLVQVEVNGLNKLV